MRRSIQYAVLFAKTFSRKHKKHIILGLLFGFLVSLILINIFPYYANIYGKKTKKIGIVGQYSETTLPRSILDQISLGLTQLSGSGEAKPSVAVSWEADDTGTNYTFHLKNNIFWHDGKKFSADDINYKLQGGKLAKVDENTLKVALEQAYSPLPVLLSAPILRTPLLGLGPYKVIKLTRSAGVITSVTLTPVEGKGETLIYRFYPSTSTAILAFKVGEIDILQDLVNLEGFDQWKNVNVSKITMYDRYVGIFFNLKDPLFKDKETRQALAYAIPKLEDQERAVSPISPYSWAYSQKLKTYDFDDSSAKKMLENTPLASPSSQLTLSTYVSHLSTAQKIADVWTAIGVNTKVKVENSPPNDYQAFLLTQAIPADPDQYQFWQSTQESTNISNYSNAKIDKLLEDGRNTLDKIKRKQIYFDFQRYLVDDVPVIFLYYPKVYLVERK